jgi:5S rRNA maturation endonuclease (ribonuclease M5)
MQSPHNKYFDLDLINELTDQACEDPERLLAELGIDARIQGKKYAGPCPIHEGDNPSAFNFYHDGESVRGIWICRTHQCHLKWKKNLAGLIQAVRSTELRRKFSWKETVDWLIKFNGNKSINDVKLPEKHILERRKASRIIHRLNISPVQKATGWTRDWVRNQLEIPSQYYVDRGYSKDILNKYDVGYYPSQNRVSVPVYDDNYKFCVGFAARSVYEQCSNCQLYHENNQDCPKTAEQIVSSTKWRNSKNFDSGNYLYNYWFAKEHILKSGVAVLVEGSGDVWRLEENNIKVGLGLFGVELTEQQRVILDRSGALSLIVLLDPDEAGKRAARIIANKLRKSYRLFFPAISGEDVGELHSDAITSDIQPYIEMALNIGVNR